LVNLLEQDHKPLLKEEGFCSGGEDELLNEEHSRSVGPREEKTKEPHQEEPETSRIASTIKISAITTPVVSATLSN
jgi:hypothetical protein